MGERPNLGRWILLVLLSAAPIWSADSVSVDLSASASRIAVGDPLTVTLTYRWPRGWTAAEPDPAADFRTCFVTDLPPVEKRQVDGSEKRTFTIRLAATRSGTWALPRPTFAARSPDAPGTVTAVAPALLIEVGSVSAAATADAVLPKPRAAWTRPPLAEVSSARWWWLAGTAVALIGGALWWRLRRAVGTAGPGPLAVFLREWEAASASGDGKDLGARLSLALRRYVGGRFAFDGPGSTTRETAAHLRGRLPDGELSALVRLLAVLDDLRWSPGALPPAALAREAAEAKAWAEGVQARLDAEAAAAEAERRAGRAAPAGTASSNAPAGAR